MPLKEKVFLQASLVYCEQTVVYNLVLHLKHGNLCPDKSYRTEKKAVGNVSTFTKHPKNSSEGEGNPPPQAMSLCSLNFCAA